MATDPHSTENELILRLLRIAMRQLAVLTETEMAIEAAIGFEGVREVRDHLERLAPEFLDNPELLTVEELKPLLQLHAPVPAD